MAPVPGNATALDPCVGPKLVPVMVTEEPAGPEFGFKAVIVTGITVKLKLLLAKPPTMTTTGPVAAPDGTSTLMLVSAQPCMVATGVPLNVTVSPATNWPKFVPVMSTDVPIGPEVGFIIVMVGATVKGMALLGTPFTTITTLPVEAPDGTGTVMLVGLQLLGVARIALKATVLDPWEAPKFVPFMVTEAPTWAPTGVMPVMFGVGKTVNATALLAATPPTVTTTLPLVAPLGTNTLILVALQIVGVAAVPLKVTVLVP